MQRESGRGNMHRFIMKAAGNSPEQIRDRINKFAELKVDPYIELYLSGLEDLFENSNTIAANCREYPGCVYSVHFPVSDHKNKYIFDPYNNEESKIKKAINLCKKINSRILILHLCFGFNRMTDKRESKERFLEVARQYNSWAKDSGIRILFENYGFVWLPPESGYEFILSPLDHFFPWDILNLQQNINKLKLDNIGMVLDFAHAVLSANMFNMLKEFPQLDADQRFGNIYDSDLAHTGALRIEDFILDFIEYLHVSDSYVWRKADGIANLKKYLYAEGLPLGSGNINYTKILKSLPADRMIVAEIHPDDGNHANNLAQLRAIEYMRDCLGKEDKVCA